ncbi:MAG: GSCFA domain-containing protein [Planctomycetes bacterium]|nr:GSCFA domain-containing protein [Planctomycetota bacterium]
MSRLRSQTQRYPATADERLIDRTLITASQRPTKAKARARDDHSPITYQRVPLLEPQTKLLTMGSCFAVELRQLMRKRGISVVPDLAGLAPHYSNVFTYALPQRRLSLTDAVTDRFVMQWYVPPSIRQEFERAFGLWEQSADDLWSARGIWQDPYRRSLFARNKDHLINFIRLLDRLMQEAIEAADLYVITLGLTEGWRKKDENLFVSAFPGDRPEQRGARETIFHRLDYDECLGDLLRICELIFNRWPQRHLVITVSPVALERTFTATDHFVANCESKSILRAAAGELSRRFEHVHYFHSYEMCMLNPPQTVFEQDGRHVQRSFVDEIVTTFIDQFASDAWRRHWAQPQAAAL